MKIDIAGVLVDNSTKQEVLEHVQKSIRSDTKLYIVTPYSEQIVFALKDDEYKRALNGARISLPDGIGIIWAAKFLENRGEGSGERGQILLHFIKTLFAIVFNPKYIRSVIPQQVTGRQFVYDLLKLASDNNYSVSLVGGENNVAAQAAYELKKIYPNLNIKLALSGRPFDDKIVAEIAASSSDILLIAYSPPKQEKWLAENITKLRVKVAIGLGGTFDYLAGNMPVAPNFVHYMGLEWLWRLITQPWRIVRIWNAVPVFAYKILKYKLRKLSS